MPLTSENMGADLASIFGDMPQEITVSRGMQRCTMRSVVSDVGGGLSPTERAAGLDYDDSVTVCVLEADCPFRIKPGDKAIVSGYSRPYSIKEVRRTVGDPVLTLTLGQG